MFTKQLILAAAALGSFAVSSAALADGETKQLVNTRINKDWMLLAPL